METKADEVQAETLCDGLGKGIPLPPRGAVFENHLGWVTRCFSVTAYQVVYRDGRLDHRDFGEVGTAIRFLRWIGGSTPTAQDPSGER